MTEKEARAEFGLSPDSAMLWRESLERMRENFLWRIEFQSKEENLRQARRGLEACNVLIPLAPSLDDRGDGELLPELKFA